jgi:hypothetical protein
MFSVRCAYFCLAVLSSLARSSETEEDADDLEAVAVSTTDASSATQYDQLSVGAFPAAFVGRWGSSQEFAEANSDSLQCFCEMKPDGRFKAVEINGRTGSRARFVEGSIEGFDQNNHLRVDVGLGLSSKFHVLDLPKR